MNEELTNFERFFLGYCIGFIDSFVSKEGSVTSEQVKQYFDLRREYLEAKTLFEMKNDPVA